MGLWLRTDGRRRGQQTVDTPAADLPEEEIAGFYEDENYGSKYALTAGGELYAWGSNAYGQLGVSANAGTSTKIIHRPR